MKSAFQAFLLIGLLPPLCSGFGSIHDNGPTARTTHRPIQHGSLNDGTEFRDHRLFVAPSKRLENDQQYTRRNILRQILTSTSIAAAIWETSPTQSNAAHAIMTDETTSFATPSLDGSYTQRSPSDPIVPPSQTAPSPPLPSDEVSITLSQSDLQTLRKAGGGGLGLELGDVSFRDSVRVVVKSVAPNSLAESLGIRPSWVVVSINGADAERTNAAGVAIYFSRALTEAEKRGERGLTLVFRDPSAFRTELRNFPVEEGEVVVGVDGDGEASAVVSTKVAPENASRGTEEEDQVVTVSQLLPPKLCRRRAAVDDLLEISYIGKVVETGTIFDGSAVKINGEAIPGRGNDISVFFVLGKQPLGQFPPGWDVGLEGMCVGERRRLLIPPVLGYGAAGVPRRGIPPNATLQYDVTLVSLNGLATPQ